ncbi:MAG: hypothetical protein GY786_04225 [Proteobacteria bacterium]|nr:hypothetical protein [Pseudomonadota bacterium]
MNVNQSNQTIAPSTPQNQSANELDPYQLHFFEAQLVSAGNKIDLLSTEDQSNAKQRVDGEESKKNSVKKEEHLDKVQENRANVLMTQATLKTAKKEDLITHDIKKAGETEKKLLTGIAEQQQSQKLQIKNQNYNDTVKERIAEKKSDLIVPTLQKEDSPSQVKNSFSEIFKLDDKQPAEMRMDNKASQEGAKSENLLKNLPGALASGLKGANLQKSEILREPNPLNKTKSTISSQKPEIGIEKSESSFKTQNQTTKNDSQLMDKLVSSSVKNDRSKKVGDFESQLKTKALPKQSDLEVDMKEVLGKVKIMMFSEKSEMVMKLTPAHLGKLEFKLRKGEDNRLIAELKVQSTEAKEILNTQLSDLKQGLEEQGVKVEEFAILVKEDDHKGSAFSSNGNNSHQKQDRSESPFVVPFQDGSGKLKGLGPENYEVESLDDGLNIIV